MAHPWFRGFDFEALESQIMLSPFSHLCDKKINHVNKVLVKKLEGELMREEFNHTVEKYRNKSSIFDEFENKEKRKYEDPDYYEESP